jgi:hypothetical protein
MGHIDDVLMQKVNNAITISFGLTTAENETVAANTKNDEGLPTVIA